MSKTEEFKSIYEEYNKLVRTVVYLNLQNDDVNDVVQEVFIKVWKRQDTLEDKTKLKTWILKITMNTLYDYFRKNVKEKQNISFDDVLVEAKKGELDAVDNQQLIKYLLKFLSEKHTEVVILNYLLGFKIDEIAQILDINSGTVKSRLHNAKEQLMKVFNQLERER